MTTNRSCVLRSLRSFGLAAVALAASAASLATGCTAPVGGEDLETSEEALTGCGVSITSNRTDNGYCGFVTVKNAGATTLRKWSVDFDLPAGVRVDFADSGISYTQAGAHVQLTPDAAHALAAGASLEIAYCNSTSASLLAQSPVAKSETCVGSTTTTTTTTTSAASGTIKSALGKYVMTWYTFQGNTPVNSSLSASGRKLIPYVSVAVPFRLLKKFGGSLDYGDQLYVEFLAGRTMPSGKKHTGWVQVDDFCGDSGDDSYCFQSLKGTKYPNVDLYVGDFTKSGMSTSTCSGPAGSGQELTNLSSGAAGAAWVADYGGRALGTGTCGDTATAKSQHGGCWYYTPPSSSKSMCGGCTSATCTDW